MEKQEPEMEEQLLAILLKILLEQQLITREEYLYAARLLYGE